MSQGINNLPFLMFIKAFIFQDYTWVLTLWYFLFREKAILFTWSVVLWAICSSLTRYLFVYCFARINYSILSMLWVSSHACIYGVAGLYFDDTADEHNPQVIEAIHRLSKRQEDERVWRLVRGDQLMMKHDHLAHNLWFKPDDVRSSLYPSDSVSCFISCPLSKSNSSLCAQPKHFYLQPYLAEIKKEEEERKRWDRMWKYYDYGIGIVVSHSYILG